ncbi:MAG: leucine-rich repeat protein [Clostridia bacterium]|nr:leucine-rich repeat protein [Clostridia bacterium]
MTKWRKIRVRTVSMILCLALLCTTIPFTAFADTDPVAATDDGMQISSDGHETKTETDAPSAYDSGSLEVAPGNTEAPSGTKSIEINTGKKGLASTVFVAPIASLTANAYQMVMSGGGSVSMQSVTTAPWNSTSDSGVKFYYDLKDSVGMEFSNNAYAGGTSLPSEYGAISYCFIYYFENPAEKGKSLYNVVPVGMTRSAWLDILTNYEKDPTHFSNGSLDYADLFATLTWVDSSNTTLPLAYSMGGDGSIVYEPHYYSVLVKWQADGGDPYYSTDNGVVYVYDGSSGGGTGTGGDGGGGTGGTSTGFVAPVSSVLANPYQAANGSTVAVGDVELVNHTDPGVDFYYTAVDSVGGTFGGAPWNTPLGEQDGVIQYAFVYADSLPQYRTIRSFTPVGTSPSAWQTAVSNYENQQMNAGGGGGGVVEFDYSDLLATLNWTSASNTRLTVYSDEAVYGAPSGDGSLHYSDRYYSVFVRWVKDGVAVYNTTGSGTVYLHEKAPDVIAAPVSNVSAVPKLISTGQSPQGGTVILPRNPTETGIDFRYTLTDGNSITWSSVPGSTYHPITGDNAVVEYLWTYTDGSYGMAPIGMNASTWQTTVNNYENNWYSQHPRTPVDYSDLVVDLTGWTINPILPLFDDAAVYGAGNGTAGQYTPRYYGCMVRVRFTDGSGYRKAFHYVSGTVYLKFGNPGELNPPVHLISLEPKTYNASSYTWSVTSATSGAAGIDTYTPVTYAYDLTDNIGQRYAYPSGSYTAVPYPATVSYLWTWIDETQVTWPRTAQIPIGMTAEAWAALIEGKSEFEVKQILATLPGWTTDPRLPIFSDGERDGVSSTDSYSTKYYGCYLRVSVPGFNNLYFLDARTVRVAAMKPSTSATISDRVYNIYEGHAAYYDVYVGHSAVANSAGVSYQWYECADANDTYGVPIVGANTYTYRVNFGSECFDRYLYMKCSYITPSGTAVVWQTNTAHFGLTDAPVADVRAYAGKNYYGGGGNEYYIGGNNSYFGGNYEGLWRPSGFTDYSRYYQTVGSVGCLSGYVSIYGECDRLEYQWLVGDSADNVNTPIGNRQVVYDPCLYMAQNGEHLYGATVASSRRIAIELECPSDAVGTKYYRLLVYCVSPNNNSHTSYSDTFCVETWPTSRRDEMFTVTPEGEVNRYLGFETELVIPSVISGVQVTKIGCFNNYNTVVGPQRIVIPEGVTEIADNAFYGLVSLTDIVLPSTLRSIGKKAFWCCGLASLTIPNGVEVIHMEAFKEAFVNTAEVTVNADGVLINRGAFAGAKMKKFILNMSVSPTLGAMVDVPSVINGDSYRGSFDGCENLYYFAFPENCSVIVNEQWPSMMIYNCPNLVWIENPQNNDFTNHPGALAPGIDSCVAKCLIYENAVRFGDWICIPDYDIIDSSIPENYFWPSRSDTPNEGWCVVKKLYSTESVVTLPSTLGGKPVTGWGGGLHYAGGGRVLDNQVYLNMTSGALEGAYWHIDLTDSPETLTQVILPSTLRNISENCCVGYTALTSVNFEDCPNLKKIGNSAFENTPLTGAVTMPGTHLSYIGLSAFQGTSVTEAHLENTVLFPNAFTFCLDLETVTGNWRTSTIHSIPTLCNYISYSGGSPQFYAYFWLVPAFPDAFNWYSCGGSVITDENADYYNSLSLFKGGDGVFRMYKTGNYWYSGTPDNATLRAYVGFDDTEVIYPEMIYNLDQKQAYHIKTVKIDDSDMKNLYTLTVQPGIEVLDCTLGRVTQVTLPEGLRDFKQSFSSSGYLTELSIPASVEEIAEVAFCANQTYERDWPKARDSIERIVFAPDSQCMTIGNSAFNGMHALTELVLPDHLEVIGMSAFGATENLTHLAIPETVRVIGDYAFASSGIESIVLPAGLTGIGEYAFDHCSNLASVTFPTSLVEIGNRAFSHCGALTSVTLPNSVLLIGEAAFEYCSSLESVVLSDSLKVIPVDCFLRCEALETVHLPANCLVIDDSAFLRCESLTDVTIPFGVVRIGSDAFYGTGILSLDIPVSVDHLGADFAGNSSSNSANWPEVYFYFHSGKLPIFEPELRYPGTSYCSLNIKRIYGNTSSGVYGIAQRNNISFSNLGIPVQYDNYRLIRIWNANLEAVSSDDVLEIRWYDADTDEWIFAGKSVELPSALARMDHTLRCDVTFTAEYVLENITEQHVSYTFLPGTKEININLAARPEVTIRFAPPMDYYGASFLLTIERPDGNRYYSVPNSEYEYNGVVYPTVEIVTPWFPATLTYSAENFDTLTLTDIEGVLPALDSEERDLGVLHPIPNGPLLHYRVNYHEPDDTELLDIYENFPGKYTLYNVTQDRNVTLYMRFGSGTFLTITDDAAQPGDLLRLTHTPERITQAYTMEPIEFTVPWADGSGELQTACLTRGTVRVTSNSSYAYLFDLTGSLIDNAKVTYSILPGTYHLVAFRDNASISISNYSQISGLGLPSEAYFDTTVVLVSGGSIEVAIPQLEPITLPAFQIDLSADKKGSYDEYVPLTVSFSFDSSLAQMEKIVVINSGADSMRDLFLDVGSHYAWPIGDTLIENVEASPNELRIRVGSLKGSFAVYARQDTWFGAQLLAGPYSSNSKMRRTPTLDGALLAWVVNSLPKVVAPGSDSVRLEVYHPTSMLTHYFRAYKNGELIEETPGCGYTAKIDAKVRSGTLVVPLPAENSPDGFQVVKYDFTVSTRPDDPAIFTFGTVSFKEDADELNTRVFDTQTVTYFPTTATVPSAVKLQINCTNHNAIKGHTYTSGTVYLDCSQPDTTMDYAFYNEYYWLLSDQTGGYLDNNGYLTEDMVYDFSLTVLNPENVSNGTVKLTVFCGETSEDPYFYVTLHYNGITGTFDGQLVLEGGQYTLDQLPAYFDIELLYEDTDSDEMPILTDEGTAASIAQMEEWFGSMKDQMSLDARGFTTIDAATLIDMLTVVMPSGANSSEILATAQDVCDYQNVMAGYYSSMMDQIGQIIDNDDFHQAILKDGFIDPALFGDDETQIEVYQDLILEHDQLIANGFTLYSGAENDYYVLQNEKGGAFYDPVSMRLQVNSYNKADPLVININLSKGKGLAPKSLKKVGFGYHKWYTFNEEIIGWADAPGWLRWALENEKAYYDQKFGASVTTLDAYLNKIYQLSMTVKMFLDLQTATVEDFQKKLDAAKFKNFENVFNILPEDYKKSAGFAVQAKTGLLGDAQLLYIETLQKASNSLDDIMKKIYAFREKLKGFYTNAVSQKKTLGKAVELCATIRKSKVADFAKGVASGLGAFMVLLDVVSGITTIVDAYDTYLGKIKGNLYNQFEWAVKRLEVTPKGPRPGEFYERYKQCVLACFDYAYTLNTLRGYYNAAYDKEVVSFVISLAADIIGAVNPEIGLAVGICNWSLGNVAEIFTVGVAGKYEVTAGQIESRVAGTCIGEKEHEEEKAKPHTIKKTHYIDPAGFVYEAVASNRIEGVTVTCYYEDSEGNPALWNAAEADQINPLITNEYGEYQWLVPVGNWRIVAEKDGYIVSDSANDPAAVNGWLPVPPPQMEVYIPLVSTALPTVESVQAGADYIRVEFSQYMDIDVLTYFGDEIVWVTDNGVLVPLDYTFIDSEVSPTNNLKYYGRILYLSRHDGQKFSGDQLKVFISKNFFNYAGNGLAENYESSLLTVGQIAATLSHSYPNRFAGSVGEEADIVVYLQDTEGNPMANAVVTVKSNGTGTLQMPASVLTDANGRAVFHTLVASSGSDTLTFTCGDASVTLNTYVNPIGTVKPEKPTANLADFQVVNYGTQLVISCATEGAVIRYTINNTCPCDENALVYEGPITIIGETFVRIAAWTETGGYSERLNLHLFCEEAEIGDVNGDGEINALDLVVMRQALLSDGSYRTALDANSDGVFNIRDLIRLKKHLVNGTPLGNTSEAPGSDPKSVQPELALPKGKIAA